MTAADVLARLAASTVAERTMASGAARLGEGTGAVTVSRDGRAVVVAEAGTWAAEGGRAMRWRAVARWQTRGTALAVEHLRQGAPASAVLDRQAGGAWVGRAAHVCGADRYAVSLHLGREAVEVTWTVEGPAKAYTVETRYTAA